MSDYVAAIVFPSNSVTYEAFTKFDNAAASLGLVGAALVERKEDGTLTIPDARDGRSFAGFGVGSLTGILVGALGGPIGMLLGWGVGATAGSLVDLDRADDSDVALEAFAKRLEPGRNAILAETSEADTSALDEAVKALGGSIVRRPIDEVIAEIEAAQDAQERAAEAARKAVREEKRAERKAAREERLAALKAKFERKS